MADNLIAMVPSADHRTKCQNEPLYTHPTLASYRLSAQLMSLSPLPDRNTAHAATTANSGGSWRKGAGAARCSSSTTPGFAQVAERRVVGWGQGGRGPHRGGASLLARRHRGQREEQAGRAPTGAGSRSSGSVPGGVRGRQHRSGIWMNLWSCGFPLRELTKFMKAQESGQNTVDGAVDGTMQL